MDKGMVRVRSEIDASTDEVRRFLGWPDLSPLQELAAITFERWLVSQVFAAVRAMGTDESTACQGPPAPSSTAR